MIFKCLPLVEGETQIYARVDEDGLIRLTCTAEYPEFKAWFGDWENDAENASKSSKKTFVNGL